MVLVFLFFLSTALMPFGNGADPSSIRVKEGDAPEWATTQAAFGGVACYLAQGHFSSALKVSSQALPALGLEPGTLRFSVPPPPVIVLSLQQDYFFFVKSMLFTTIQVTSFISSLSNLGHIFWISHGAAQSRSPKTETITLMQNKQYTPASKRIQNSQQRWPYIYIQIWRRCAWSRNLSTFQRTIGRFWWALDNEAELWTHADAWSLLRGKFQAHDMHVLAHEPTSRLTSCQTSHWTSSVTRSFPHAFGQQHVLGNDTLGIVDMMETSFHGWPAWSHLHEIICFTFKRSVLGLLLKIDTRVTPEWMLLGQVLQHLEVVLGATGDFKTLAFAWWFKEVHK